MNFLDWCIFHVPVKFYITVLQNTIYPSKQCARVSILLLCLQKNPSVLVSLLPKLSSHSSIECASEVIWKWFAPLEFRNSEGSNDTLKLQTIESRDGNALHIQRIYGSINFSWCFPWLASIVPILFWTEIRSFNALTQLGTRKQMYVQIL